MSLLGAHRGVNPLDTLTPAPPVSTPRKFVIPTLDQVNEVPELIAEHVLPQRPNLLDTFRRQYVSTLGEKRSPEPLIERCSTPPASSPMSRSIC